MYPKNYASIQASYNLHKALEINNEDLRNVANATSSEFEIWQSVS